MQGTSPLQTRHSHQGIDLCNVFVKFLPSNVADADLYQMFSTYGNIISAKVMVDHQSGNSLGYGFVRYYAAEDAQKAIKAMSGKKIDNKTLLCKLSNSPTNPSTANLHPDTNLYIKPLPETTTEESLYESFAKFGKILECKVMVDKHTGSSRQIGFVRFEEQAAATLAMTSMNGQRLEPDSPPLIVRYAETESQKSARKLRNISKQHAAYYGQPVYAHPIPIQSPPFGVPSHLSHSPQDGQLYAGQMSPVSISYMPIQSLPYVPSPTGSPHLGMMSSSPPYASSPPFPRHHSPVISHMPHSQTSPIAIPHRSSTSPIPIRSPVMHSNLSPIPLSPSQYSQSPRGEPNLFVFHLPSDFDDEQLRATFEKFGMLESVKVISDRETKESKGYGFVKFVYMEDAIRAVNVMNGASVGNKHLKVSFKTSRGKLSPNTSPSLRSRHEHD